MHFFSRWLVYLRGAVVRLLLVPLAVIFTALMILLFAWLVRHDEMGL